MRGLKLALLPVSYVVSGPTFLLRASFSLYNIRGAGLNILRDSLWLEWAPAHSGTSSFLGQPLPLLCFSLTQHCALDGPRKLSIGVPWLPPHSVPTCTIPHQASCEAERKKMEAPGQKVEPENQSSRF